MRRICNRHAKHAAVLYLFFFNLAIFFISLFYIDNYSYKHIY